VSEVVELGDQAPGVRCRPRSAKRPLPASRPTSPSPPWRRLAQL